MSTYITPKASTKRATNDSNFNHVKKQPREHCQRISFTTTNNKATDTTPEHNPRRNMPQRHNTHHTRSCRSQAVSFTQEETQASRRPQTISQLCLPVFRWKIPLRCPGAKFRPSPRSKNLERKKPTFSNMIPCRYARRRFRLPNRPRLESPGILGRSSFPTLLTP